MIQWICRALLLAGLAAGTAVYAQVSGNTGIVITDASGTLRYRIGSSDSLPLAKGQVVPFGARINTGTDSRVVLTYPDGMVIALGAQSRLLTREFVFVPSDPAKSRVLLNLTDGSISMIMGAIGQRDPGLLQLQVGTKVTPQSPRRAPGKDVGVIVLGIQTLVQVGQGRVLLFVPSSEQAISLTSGDRALVQPDGNVRTGPPSQAEQAANDPDGKIMLGRMEELRRNQPAAGQQIVFFVSTPPPFDPYDELEATASVEQPVTVTAPTASTGAGGGGKPCAASCN